MIISITGKSGSGKTFIARMLASRLCAEHVSFDEISHKTLEMDDILAKIQKKFGNSVFDGKKINRKKLGQIVFNNPSMLTLINHHAERIMETIIDEIIKTNQKPYIILEYALLPKMKYFSMCDFKILVTATEAIRFERVLNRDGISEEYLKSREANSPSYIVGLFDVVVENNSNEELNVDNVVKLIKNKENLC